MPQIRIQRYPRRDDFLAEGTLFPRPNTSLTSKQLSAAIGGAFERCLKDKNLTRPYLCVVCIATPQRGVILPYELGRSIRRNRDGYPYSPNCEVWSPGFVFPYVSGLDAEEVYRTALQQVGAFLPFHTLARRKECSQRLAEELKRRGLVSAKTGRLDMVKFQRYVTERRRKIESTDHEE